MPFCEFVGGIHGPQYGNETVIHLTAAGVVRRARRRSGMCRKRAEMMRAAQRLRSNMGTKDSAKAMEEVEDTVWKG